MIWTWRHRVKQATHLLKYLRSFWEEHSLIHIPNSSTFLVYPTAAYYVLMYENNNVFFFKERNIPNRWLSYYINTFFASVAAQGQGGFPEWVCDFSICMSFCLTLFFSLILLFVSLLLYNHFFNKKKIHWSIITGTKVFIPKTTFTHTPHMN